MHEPSRTWRPAGRNAASIVLGTLASLAGSGCSTAHDVREALPVLDVRYPDAPSLDYAPERGMAHAALPIFDVERQEFVGPSRIWIKGSAAATRVKVDGGESLELFPPFYTDVVEVEGGSHRVEFGGEGELTLDVETPRSEELNSESDRLMLLAYGCFDPFDIDGGDVFVSPGDGTGKPGLKEDVTPRYLAIRELFRAAARGTVPRTQPASLVIGAGDQVYVEPAHDRYGEYGVDHPLSAWTVEAYPRPRMALRPFIEFLDRTYRAFWSFETMDEVFRTTPSVMMWDDHEIRDGWGSQGDEHIYRDTYFAAARDAFLAHQHARGPARTLPSSGELTASLHSSFVLNGVSVFVTDQRSARDVRVPQVLGEAQSRDLLRWLDEVDPSRSPYCVIVSQLPMLFRASGLLELAARFDDEIWDDMIDSWSSDANVDELNRLTSALAAASERGVRPILISGDMHTSALLRAKHHLEDGAGEAVFAYEIVASGLASVVDGASWKHTLARKNSILGGSIRAGEYDVSIELGISDTVPNFAGLEFAEGRAFAHLFQSHADTLVHYRVPLEWGRDTTDLSSQVDATCLEIRLPVGNAGRRSNRPTATDRRRATE